MFGRKTGRSSWTLSPNNRPYQTSYDGRLECIGYRVTGSAHVDPAFYIDLPLHPSYPTPSPVTVGKTLEGQGTGQPLGPQIQEWGSKGRRSVAVHDLGTDGEIPYIRQKRTNRENTIFVGTKVNL